MERNQLIKDMLAAKSRNAVSYAGLAATIGRHRIWLAAAMLGHAQFTEPEACTLLQGLGFAASPDEIACLSNPHSVEPWRPFQPNPCSTDCSRSSMSMAPPSRRSSRKSSGMAS